MIGKSTKKNVRESRRRNKIFCMKAFDRENFCSIKGVFYDQIYRGKWWNNFLVLVLVRDDKISYYLASFWEAHYC